MIKEAERLARNWMPGRRNGPAKRYAWEHPQDLVDTLGRMPSKASPEEREARVAIAWLHDLVEDGKKEDQSRVTYLDLLKHIPGPIVEDVLVLSQREGEPKQAYLARLQEASPRVKVIKCVDRICNLWEGRDSFKKDRWIRYVGETYYFIYPLSKDVPNPERSWLQQELLKAAQSRNIGAFEA